MSSINDAEYRITHFRYAFEGVDGWQEYYAESWAEALRLAQQTANVLGAAWAIEYSHDGKVLQRERLEPDDCE